MKIYFLGGEDIKKRDSEKINKKAFADAGGSPAVLVFPWSRQIEKVEYRIIITEYFKNLGARKIGFAELADSRGILLRKIAAADILYLPGGNSKLLVTQLRQARLTQVIRNFDGVVIGNSAGSLALCKRYVLLRGQDGEPKVISLRGIGPADFAVSVHYKSGYNKELLQLSKENPELKIYAIPERAVLVWDGNNVTTIGRIYLFAKNKKSAVI